MDLELDTPNALHLILEKLEGLDKRIIRLENYRIARQLRLTEDLGDD